MRKRFRGNQPVGVSQDLESHIGRGQLYAGGGTLWDVKQHQQQHQHQHQQQNQEQRLHNADSAEDEINREGV